MTDPKNVTYGKFAQGPRSYPAVDFKSFVGPFRDMVYDGYGVVKRIRFNEPHGIMSNYWPSLDADVQIWPRAFFHFCECGSWGFRRHES